MNQWKRVTNPIFVFGSNLAGRHGKGAALHAREAWGAVYGQGEGLQGCSYAIPTKDEDLQTLPLDQIKGYLEEFFDHALNHPENTYLLTPIGTGLAGYKVEEILELIRGIPKARWVVNVVYTKEWHGL